MTSKPRSRNPRRGLDETETLAISAHETYRATIEREAKPNPNDVPFPSLPDDKKEKQSQQRPLDACSPRRLALPAGSMHSCRAITLDPAGRAARTIEAPGTKLSCTR